MLKEIRKWDGVAGAALILIIFLSAYSLELTYWTYDLNRVTILAMLGLVFGLSIGLSSFSEKTSTLISGIFGFEVLFLQLVVSLSQAPLWMDRFNTFFQKFENSVNQLIHNIPLEDGILFLILAGALFFFISLNLGKKFIRQEKSWIGFLTIVFFYFLIQFYLPSSQRNYFFISIYYLLVIIFLGRQTYLTRERKWKENGIRTDKDTSAFFNKYIYIFTLTLIIISLGIPQVLNVIGSRKKNDLSNAQIREYSTSWGVLRNFFYPLRQQTGFGEGYLPEILVLGSSRSMKDVEAFKVKVSGTLEYPNRYYWKGRSYDYYENGLWQSKDILTQQLASVEIKPFAAQSTVKGNFTFIYAYPREIIFTPQIIHKVNREAEINYFTINNEYMDVQSIVDDKLVHTDEQIEILGGFNNPDWRLLINSSENYPKWVTSRYLQLPPDFSEKITSLAEDLAFDSKTRIEKAITITNYLRNAFRYKDTVKIPKGKDPIEWFLFEGREGFCNYFATADVLMLRSIGIPARMVVGYAEGERILENDEFLVKIKDNHSWVEAFFPGSGWIILEPTPIQPNVIIEEKLTTSEDLSKEETLILGNEDLGKRVDSELFSRINEKYEIIDQIDSSQKFPMKIILSVLMISISLISGIIFSLAYLIVFRKKEIGFPGLIEQRIIQNGHSAPDWISKWANYEKLPAIQKAYRNLHFISEKLLFQEEERLTPREFFAKLNRYFETNEQSGKLFLDQYQELTYGNSKSSDTGEYFKDYKKILALIFKSWREKIIAEYRSRFLLY